MRRRLIALGYFLLALVVILAFWVGLTILFAWLGLSLPSYVAGSIFGTEVVLDWLITVRMLRAKVGIYETNPIHALAIATVGYVGDFILVLIWMVIIFLFVWSDVSPAAQVGVCCVYLLVFLNNGAWYYVRIRRARQAQDLAERYKDLAQGYFTGETIHDLMVKVGFVIMGIMVLTMIIAAFTFEGQEGTNILEIDDYDILEALSDDQVEYYRGRWGARLNIDMDRYGR